MSDYKVDKYKFNEDVVLNKLKNHILGTYDQRYGKKDGRNEQDLLKILHYGIILMGSKIENKETRESYTSEYNQGN